MNRQDPYDYTHTPRYRPRTVKRLHRLLSTPEIDLNRWVVRGSRLRLLCWTERGR